MIKLFISVLTSSMNFLVRSLVLVQTEFWPKFLLFNSLESRGVWAEKKGSEPILDEGTNNKTVKRLKAWNWSCGPLINLWPRIHLQAPQWWRAPVNSNDTGDCLKKLKIHNLNSNQHEVMGVCSDVFLTKCRLSEHSHQPTGSPDIYYKWDGGCIGSSSLRLFMKARKYRRIEIGQRKKTTFKKNVFVFSCVEQVSLFLFNKMSLFNI